MSHIVSDQIVKMSSNSSKRRRGNKSKSHRKRHKKSKHIHSSSRQEIIISKQPNHSQTTSAKPTTKHTKTREKTLKKLTSVSTSTKDVKPLPFSSTKEHLTEADGEEYSRCLRETYCGFAKEQLSGSKLQGRVGEALRKLARLGYFHYDIVQYGKAKLNSTRVQRILVGKPGITYLYQNLRLFALPVCYCFRRLI